MEAHILVVGKYMEIQYIGHQESVYVYKKTLLRVLSYIHALLTLRLPSVDL